MIPAVLLFPVEVIPQLVRGAIVTVELTLLAGMVALACAFTAGLLRLSPHWFVRLPVTVYVEVFRGSSALVQLFFFFYVLPLLGVALSALAAGVLALGLNVGAYGSEIVRAAIRNVDPGQREAITALNLPPVAAFMRIILPQALSVMLPPFGNLLIELLKATSLCSLITITELTFAGKEFLYTHGDIQEIYAMVLVFYFVIAYTLTTITRVSDRRLRARLHVGRPA